METPIADPAAPARPPYIECEDCCGRGFRRVRNDDSTYEYAEHYACDGSGILILRIPRNGGEPYYGTPKLW
jgi:hypothetical protein